MSASVAAQAGKVSSPNIGTAYVLMARIRTRKQIRFITTPAL